MAVSHSTTLIIAKSELRDVGEARQSEARVLFRKGFYSGAMFLAGCALECYLKVAICKTLKLDGLPSAFKTHDLGALILYSGYQRDMELMPTIKKSYDRILERWRPDGRESLLYYAPNRVSEREAAEFLKCVGDPQTGVIPWLQRMIS